MSYNLRVNKNGSIVGDNTEGIKRVAAHTYRVPSETTAGTVYNVYVEDLFTKCCRCSCLSFVINGSCKHEASVIDFENEVKNNFSTAYIGEQVRRITKRLNIVLE